MGSSEDEEPTDVKQYGNNPEASRPILDSTLLVSGMREGEGEGEKTKPDALLDPKAEVEQIIKLLSQLTGMVQRSGPGSEALEADKDLNLEPIDDLRHRFNRMALTKVDDDGQTRGRSAKVQSQTSLVRDTDPDLKGQHSLRLNTVVEGEELKAGTVRDTTEDKLRTSKSPQESKQVKSDTDDFIKPSISRSASWLVRQQAKPVTEDDPIEPRLPRTESFPVSPKVKAESTPEDLIRSEQRRFEANEKMFGPDHLSTLDIVHNIGYLYGNQFHFKEAEQLFKKAIRGKEKALGPEHISTLDSVNNLGMLYAQQGWLSDAEEIYKRTLRGYEKTVGPDHISSLDVVHNLGYLYAQQGQFRGSEEMFQRAVQGKEKALGAEHISTLDTVNNLGIVYARHGQLGEAEKIYERALQGYEKAMGAEHITTLDIVHNLGYAYAYNGKLAEAEQMYERALRGKEKVLGVDHVSTLDTANTLGRLHARQGRLTEAGQLYKRALEGREKAFGSDHRLTLETVNNIGQLSIARAGP